MYQVRQFRPTLYLLLIMGVSGFTIAAQTPGLWVLAMGGMFLNAWLIRTNRFVPLPRLLATAATLLAALVTVSAIRSGSAVPLLAIGEFLVIMHLVKLFEQRANRDYAQLLVLSLLLMAAGAISTASLWFGILLVIYLFISLYCSLLFHLKMEADAANARFKGNLILPAPATQRRDEQRLAGSMRRLTAMVAVMSMVMAVLVFLFFPRNTGEGIFGRRLSGTRTMTGFSDSVTLDRVAEINQSEDPIAQVRVTRGGKPWGGTSPLLLRGTTLDVYHGPDGFDVPWRWERTGQNFSAPIVAKAGDGNSFGNAAPEDIPYIQDITLQSTGTQVVFAMAGAFELTPKNDFHGKYWSRDGVLATDQQWDNSGILCYTVKSSGNLPVGVDTRLGRNSWIDPDVAAFARRPEVGGVDAAGRSLASLIGTPDAPPDVNRLIAESMAAYLRTHFTYTLDLTSYRNQFGEDPLRQFLYEVKKGHCEMFAGAMTIMCQSLGIPARMVLGYRCDEYNPVGEYYQVRQSHAHAWVEVLTDAGWETLDPTSGNEAMASTGDGWMGRAKNIFDYVEYRWGTAVIAYGQENRQEIMQAMDLAVVRGAENSTDQVQKIPSKFTNAMNIISSIIANPTWVSVMIVLMVSAMVGTVAYYLYEQAQLRRRASRIGLNRLSAAERQRLARQLGFYDELLRLLERRGIMPSPTVTPMEFSDHLTFLPREAYHDIRRLTRLFYRIRYGRAELNSRRQRLVGEAVTRLATKIA